MRRIREVAAEEERFRIEDTGGGIGVVRRDPVQPEPIGTIILLPVRVIGYDPDCDGSLMARLEVLGLDELHSPIDPELLTDQAWKYAGVLTNYGLYSTTGIVVTPEEVSALLPPES